MLTKDELIRAIKQQNEKCTDGTYKEILEPRTHLPFCIVGKRREMDDALVSFRTAQMCEYCAALDIVLMVEEEYRYERIAVTVDITKIINAIVDAFLMETSPIDAVKEIPGVEYHGIGKTSGPNSDTVERFTLSAK